jgi:hypothetical protein
MPQQSNNGMGCLQIQHIMGMEANSFEMTMLVQHRVGVLMMGVDSS